LINVVQQRFGAQDDLHDIEIAGKTDRAIIRDILRKHKQAADDESVADFARDYVAGLRAELPRRDGRLLPGIFALLTRLKANPQIALGLLTGNLREGARLKLEHYRLAEFFDFGAFADDHHDRNELGEFACRRATETHGQTFEGGRIDVIGDTGHDIACGKAIGARTVAVATGGWSRAELARCRPDFLFDDFSHVEEVVAQMGW
jgi:phosphoglycolate phosphatase-like HAD superfamily hydrolase